MMSSQADREIDVLVIGGGPAGLSAATRLKQLGIRHVLVLDREPVAGGIPRHCGHPPFGMREFKRVMTGPSYAAKLIDTALKAGVEIRTSTTVTALKPGGHLLIADHHGVSELSAKRIIYATGVRETPRSARLIPGSRPGGILNTGALQSMVYLKQRRPFKLPVIIGSELVSVSAIQTCRHAGIKVQAMIEANPRITARRPVGLFAKLSGVPVYTDTHIIRVEGKNRVEALIVKTAGKDPLRIDCDGLIVSGKFTPESSLARCGHLEIDPATSGPRVDQFGRCSDPVYFAAGNILRPVETAGWSWKEGWQIAQFVADDLAGVATAHDTAIHVFSHDALIQYVMPQLISSPDSKPGFDHLQLRFTGPAKGRLYALQNEKIIWSKTVNSLPERRIEIPVSSLRTNSHSAIELKFEPRVST